MLISGNVHLLLSSGARMVQAKTKGTARDFTQSQKGVLNSKTRAPGSLTLTSQFVREGVREEVTHEDVPTTSENIMATVYDPGEDTE
jgi:hypothetical protein